MKTELERTKVRSGPSSFSRTPLLAKKRQEMMALTKPPEKTVAGASLGLTLCLSFCCLLLREATPSLSKAPLFTPVKSTLTAVVKEAVFLDSMNSPVPGGNLIRPQLNPLDEKSDVYNQKEIKVAVIDSGLGGLAIMAEAASRLEKSGFYRRADLIFFNALFSREKGYNALPTREARLEMFDKVLASLEKKVCPDLILIACNTLSTLYPSTRFAQKTKIPVLDIIQPGVNLISNQLKKYPDSVVLILATPITINEDTHRQALLKLGFPLDRLFVQACPELEVFIEKNPEGEETGLLIAGFLEEGLQKLPKPTPPAIISLNCTHYGYSLPLWEKAVQESRLASSTLITPNSSLLDLWLKPGLKRRFKLTSLRPSVLSRVEIKAETREIIAKHLGRISPATAEALRHYLFDPDLF